MSLYSQTTVQPARRQSVTIAQMILGGAILGIALLLAAAVAAPRNTEGQQSSDVPAIATLASRGL